MALPALSILLALSDAASPHESAEIFGCRTMTLDLQVILQSLKSVPGECLEEVKAERGREVK